MVMFETLQLLGFFFLQFSSIKIFMKFSIKLAKLVEFAIQKQGFPKLPQFFCGEIFFWEKKSNGFGYNF
jgi:hypothetical protein